MRLVQILIVALFPLLLSGCLAVAAAAAGGVGYYKYKENEAHRDYRASVEETWEATLGALERVGHPAPRVKWHTETEGEIEDDDLWVKVEARSNDYTRVSVRIGTFDTEGHRRKAAVLLEKIEKEIGS